jgi:hypothetical protein
VPRYWTCHWQNRFWRDDVNPEYEPVCGSGSNIFRKRGVSVGDVAYVISLADGHLLLGGRMTVKRIISRREAVKVLNEDTLYDADEFIIDEDRSGTPLNLHRRLAPSLARQLHFVSPRAGPKGLSFVSDAHLDNQATRGVRELTPESAALLDRIIEITDRLPRSGELITITEEMLHDGQGSQEAVIRPEEVPGGSANCEGNVSAFAHGFNPLIDRYDHRSVARLFRWFWPDSDIALAFARALAASIRVAHEASDACWEVTLFPDMLRLNVGQVEVLKLTADEAMFLFRAPLDAESAAPCELQVSSDPVFAAVPVPSGVCFIAADDLPSLPSAVREAHNAYINAAASFKRVSPFKKSFSPAAWCWACTRSR